MRTKLVASPAAAARTDRVAPTKVNEMPDADGPSPPGRSGDGPARSTGGSDDRPSGWRGIRPRLWRTLDRVRASPTGRIALKIVVGVLGTVVVAVGILLIPLPGPGWALVIVGLAILAIEFSWARRLLQFTRRHVRAWSHWVSRRSLPLRLLIGAASLVFVAVVVWGSVRVTLGVDLVAVGRHFLATR